MAEHCPWNHYSILKRKIMNKNTTELKTALAHDWLNGMRGGERVLEVICDMFPEAPVFTLFHEPSKISDTIEKHKITASWLNNLPFARQNHRLFLPLFPVAIKSLRFPDAQVIISTSHCAAKAVIPPPGAKHLCYCFTPMRYAWGFYNEYFGSNPLKKAVIKPLLSGMRAWDRKTCTRVDRFVTLSHYVKNRIKQFYNRDADVVYPPVATLKWTPAASGKTVFQGKELGDFDLIVSALVPYKRLDLAVEAYNRLGYPLKIVGTGPLLEKLRLMAKPNITFTGWLDDNDILTLYRTCRALIFPGEEDFGIVPVEAQACGRPVVAFNRGGATETVVDGVSGIFFSEQTENSLIAAIEKTSAREWDISAIRKNAEKFSEANFIEGITKSIEKCLQA